MAIYPYSTATLQFKLKCDSNPLSYWDNRIVLTFAQEDQVVLQLENTRMTSIAQGQLNCWLLTVNLTADETALFDRRLPLQMQFQFKKSATTTGADPLIQTSKVVEMSVEKVLNQEVI